MVFPPDEDVYKRQDIDRPENGIRIAYQDGDRIQSITDSIGRVYCFGYNPKGQLISIACQEQDGRQIQFSTENGAKVPFVLEYSYDNSGNLIQASYPDGECVRYDYTRTGRLSQIHTVDEKQFAISYDGKRVKQIEQIADVGTQAHRKTLIEMNQEDVYKRQALCRSFSQAPSFPSRPPSSCL